MKKVQETPDCLSVDEIERAILKPGSLSSELQEHLFSCDSCKTFLHLYSDKIGSMPSKELNIKIKELQDEDDSLNQKEINISSRLLIRLNKNKTLDEVVSFDEDGVADFHMEQMDDNQWWMRWYSTDARPLPREVIVNLGFNKTETNAFQSFDSAPVHRDGRDNRDPKKEIDSVVRYFGMKRLLEEMIVSTKDSTRDEKTNWPDRDTSYLDQLVADLENTLKNYEARHPGEPDYYSDEPEDQG